MNFNCKFIAILLVCAVSLVVSSCNKDEYLSQAKRSLIRPSIGKSSEILNDLFFPITDIDNYDFFGKDINNIGYNEFAHAVYRELEFQETNYGIVANIVSKIGYPMWDGLYATNENSTTDLILMIPFENGSEELSGIIYCAQDITGNLRFALIEKSKLLEFIVNHPQSLSGMEPILALGVEMFDYSIYEKSNEEIHSYLGGLSSSNSLNNREDCWTIVDCTINHEEQSTDNNANYVTGGITNTSMFVGDFLLPHLVWFHLFFGSWEDCHEFEVCIDYGDDSNLFNNPGGDWTTGFEPGGTGNGGLINSEPSNGVNDHLDLTLEEIDEFEQQLFLFGSEYDLPFSVDELNDWVSYNCMNEFDRLEMECAWESFQNNFQHSIISPFLEELDWDIAGLVGSTADIENCLNSDDFGECVIIELTEELEDCNTYDFIWCNNLVDALNGICPESFKFTSLGNNATFTCDIRDISFTYKGAVNQNMFIGDLCITVPKRDIDGVYLAPYEASELFSSAWNNAMDLTAAAYASSNHTLTSVAYKNLFISNLKVTMILYFQGSFGQGTMNVTTQHCFGNLPIGRPKYSIFCW